MLRKALTPHGLDLWTKDPVHREAIRGLASRMLARDVDAVSDLDEYDLRVVAKMVADYDKARR